MNKKDLFFKILDVAYDVAQSVSVGVGVTIAYSELSKNFKIKKRAAYLAKYEEKEIGETVEIFIHEAGIPLLIKQYAREVATYKVVNIKNNKYKMVYIGSRSFTKKEMEDYYCE